MVEHKESDDIEIRGLSQEEVDKCMEEHSALCGRQLERIQSAAGYLRMHASIACLIMAEAPSPSKVADDYIQMVHEIMGKIRQWKTIK